MDSQFPFYTPPTWLGGRTLQMDSQFPPLDSSYLVRRTHSPNGLPVPAPRLLLVILTNLKYLDP